MTNRELLTPVERQLPNAACLTGSAQPIGGPVPGARAHHDPADPCEGGVQWWEHASFRVSVKEKAVNPCMCFVFSKGVMC